MTFHLVYLTSNIAVALTAIFAAILIIYNRENKVIFALSLIMLIRLFVAMTVRLLLNASVEIGTDLLQPTILFAGYPVAVAFALYPYFVISPKKLDIKWLINYLLPMFIIFMICGFAASLGATYRILPDFNTLVTYIGETNVWVRVLLGIGCDVYPVMAMIKAYRAIKAKHPKSDVLWIYVCSVSVTNINFLIMVFYMPLWGLFLQQIALTLFFGYMVIRLFILRNRESKQLAQESFHMNLDLKERLIELMNLQKPYLNSKITLPKVASMARTNRTTLSTTIKEMGYASFTDFCNSYRMREFESEIKNGNKSSLDEIALKSGFGSTATLYRYCREKKQITPAQYIKSLKQKQDKVHVEDIF